MHACIQFRRRSDTRWQAESDFDERLEAARQHIENSYTLNGCNCSYRDYVIRLIDLDTEHVYIQGQPASAFRNPETWPVDISEIPWNEPGESALTGEKVHMINVGIRRLNGKLTLLVNAKEFHEELDKIGVQHSTTDYLDQPASATTVASSSFQLSPKVLLRRDYKEVEYKDGAEMKKMPVTATYDLSAVWNTPPSFEQLKKLCNSAEPVARKILEHYQPIDISVEIHKKIVK